jgi:proteasome lid subunit RPN8/RPN11
MTISPAAIDVMIAHAREDAPRECCGLLIGSSDRIESAHRARNLEPSAARFLIDPQDHFAAIRAARAAGRAVVGVYHSHPSAAALPSPSDLAEVGYAEYAYAIVSLASNPPDVRVFRLEQGAFAEMSITQGRASSAPTEP